ncbi:hypothetical protein CU098_008413 [Rhizopus stolonifer]|uniref:Uncharacterized protein n=1 Tax=Rhizopus stolonifer TaxID=4846 RepID=A0A367JD56_RHIST|nr:hypothetical protein CU098_008413 [Rhizopus stolonifer]
MSVLGILQDQYLRLAACMIDYRPKPLRIVVISVEANQSLQDKQSIIPQYLAKMTLLSWKYENILKILLNHNLQEVKKTYQARNNVDDGSKGKEKPRPGPLFGISIG